MKNLKKKALMAASYVAVAALAIGGTFAYLSDTDGDGNTMPLGNVKIEQIEQEWNEAGTELVDFTQGKALYPYVGTLGWENNKQDGGAYRRFTMENVVDKYVSVKNTGKSEAYVRTIIALEMGGYNDIAEFRNNIIGISRNELAGGEFKFDGAWTWNKGENDDTKADDSDYFVAEIDGNNYLIMVATHKDALQPDATTIPSLNQVYMNKDCGNEEAEKLDGNKNGTYDILVLTQAVQTEGFSDAATALNTAFGKVTDEGKIQEWFASDKVVIPTVVATDDELAVAIKNSAEGDMIYVKDGTYELEAGTSIPVGISLIATSDNAVLSIPAPTTKNTSAVTLGANTVLKGFTIIDNGNGDGIGDAGLVTVNGENAVIENCSFDISGTNATAIALGGGAKNTTIKGCDFVGGFKHIGPAPGTTGGIVIDDCTFKEGSYAIHLNATTNDVIVKNSTVALFNTFFGFGEDEGKLVFDNCDFVAESGKTNVVKLYRDAEFVNCDFEDKFMFSDADKDITVVFEGGSWGEGTIKDHFLNDSFTYNMDATFDGDAWYWNTTIDKWEDK